MLINRDDIIRYQGNIEIPQIGQTVITGFGEIAMSKETGVVFIAQFIDGTKLDKFIVGAFNPTGVLDQIKTFADKTEKDFFEAVKYFEELIKSRQPEEEKSPPSVGKFYFFKKSIGKDAYVSIGDTDIIIEASDIQTVFSPPKTKPLGRLNLKDTTNPGYEPIRAKFALKYLNQECEEMAKANNWNLSDFGIYDMTPYEFGDENQGEPQPEDVNSINPNDIEDEDLEKKPEEKKPQEKKPKEKDGKPEDEGKPEDDESPEDEGEPGDDEGEPGDDEGEPGDDKKKKRKKGKPNEEGEPTDEPGEPTDEPGEPTDDEGEPTDDEGEPTDEDGKPTDDEREPGDDENESKNKRDNENKHNKHKLDVDTDNLKSSLEKFFEIKDLKRSFRNQKNLIMALNNYNEKEKDSLIRDLKLPTTMKKEEFINLIQQETKQIFN
jgi:hypothetical protein